jgi:hypothetical protein
VAIAAAAAEVVVGEGHRIAALAVLVTTQDMAAGNLAAVAAAPVEVVPVAIMMQWKLIFAVLAVEKHIRISAVEAVAVEVGVVDGT